MEKYSTVKELFENEFPILVSSLEQGGGYWPKVKDNTISNEVLASNVWLGITIEKGELSAVNLSSKALLAARLMGKVPEQQKDVIESLD